MYVHNCVKGRQAGKPGQTALGAPSEAVSKDTADSVAEQTRPGQVGKRGLWHRIPPYSTPRMEAWVGRRIDEGHLARHRRGD